MSGWTPPEPPHFPTPRFGQRVKMVLRFAALAVLLSVGLGVKLMLRVVERPVFGAYRPWTPHITRAVCGQALRIMGLDLRIAGRPMTHHGAVVANHSSWLDIFVLNACQTIYFVSKSEVATWPGIGLLARATGTVFIKRDPKEARAQEQVFSERLQQGHKLLFFPEGTSTDGSVVLPFKSTLFAALFKQPLQEVLWIQPVSVYYKAPETARPDHFGWWGDMDFAPHLLFLLSQGGGCVQVRFHESLKISDWPDRKTLAKHCEEVVRAGHGEGLSEG